jgi:hypothetical protein
LNNGEVPFDSGVYKGQAPCPYEMDTSLTPKSADP